MLPLGETMSDDKHWLEPPKWWKKVKPLRWLAIGGIIFVVVSVFYTAKVLIAPSAHPETDKFTARVSDPVPFIEGLNSYDTVEKVKARLDAAKVQSILTTAHPAPNSKYPPHDRDTLVAGTFPHLGVDGKLTLEFFNDRLYEATFIPSEPDTYAGKLHAADQRLKRQKSGRMDITEGALRIASNVDFAATDVGRNLQTKPYVIWQDTRLVDLLDDWDRRFVISSQPK